MWRWPLFEGPVVWPDGPGTFGARRKHDVHTGVDLYTWPGMSVLAVEPGVVVAVEDYTGPNAGSPWWLPTQAVLVEGASGVVCYGEVAPLKKTVVGARVAREDCIAGVKSVLRSNKGRPMTMLHLELYVAGTRESVWWRLDEPRPPELLDPTELLRAAWEATGRGRVYPGQGPLVSNSDGTS